MDWIHPARLPGAQVVIAEWTPEQLVYCGDGNMQGPGAEKAEVCGDELPPNIVERSPRGSFHGTTTSMLL